jgi:hypothetical protein
VNSKDIQSVVAAEFAVKAYVLKSNPRLLVDTAKGGMTLREIEDAVDLTEAPADAICSLVADLLKYCKREKIDWDQEVMLRAMEQFQMEGS